MSEQTLHIETPLVESLPLSRKVRGKVWLKMEALQPTGSFKLRGIGHACRTHAAGGTKRFVCSSGGNAGIAVAYSGRMLGIPVTVVVPQTTSARAIAQIKEQAAEVLVAGASWQEAHEHAIQRIEEGWVYIHPFDDPLLWEGHATIIDETVRQGVRPEAVVVSVGGGGLLCGVVEGLRRNALHGVQITAVETRGADSLSECYKQKRHTALTQITSIATSLGAKKVAATAYAHCLEHGVHSRVVSDSQAVRACLRFSRDHRILVEPACGAALAAVYEPDEALRDKQNILVVVCGGAGVTIQQLERWSERLHIKTEAGDA